MFPFTPTRVGLILAGILALGDIATLPFISSDDGSGPPIAVVIIGVGLGLVSLALVALAWRGSRGAIKGVLATRILAALLAVPGLFEPGVSAGLRFAAGTGVLLAIVTTVLLVRALRTEPQPVAVS